MPKSLKEVAQQILEETSSAAATLKPNSKGAEPTKKLDGQVQELGGPVVAVNGSDGDNLGAKAATAVSKDTSAPTKTAKAGDPPKKLTEEEIAAKFANLQEFQVNAIVEHLDTLSEEELDAITEENIDELVKEAESLTEEEEAEEGTETVSEEAEAEVPELPIQVDMKEHIDALFHGEELSEEFKAKATAIFEAAVTSKLVEYQQQLDEAAKVSLDAAVEQITEQLGTSVDDYLNYIVEQWVSENEVAIESSLRSEITEEFMTGLRNLFTENYIDVPEEQVNVVEELTEKVEEVTAKLNEELARNVALNKQLNESKRTELFTTETAGLTAVQVEKLKGLTESVEFTTPEEFAGKIKTLRENYFPTKTPANGSKELEQASGEDPSKMILEEGPMSKYVQTIGRTLPR